jgi:hypothetical protein
LPDEIKPYLRNKLIAGQETVKGKEAMRAYLQSIESGYNDPAVYAELEQDDQYQALKEEADKFMTSATAMKSPEGKRALKALKTYREQYIYTRTSGNMGTYTAGWISSALEDIPELKSFIAVYADTPEMADALEQALVETKFDSWEQIAVRVKDIFKQPELYGNTERDIAEMAHMQPVKRLEQFMPAFFNFINGRLEGTFTKAGYDPTADIQVAMQAVLTQDAAVRLNVLPIFFPFTGGITRGNN